MKKLRLRSIIGLLSILCVMLLSYRTWESPGTESSDHSATMGSGGIPDQMESIDNNPRRIDRAPDSRNRALNAPIQHAKATTSNIRPALDSDQAMNARSFDEPRIDDPIIEEILETQSQSVGVGSIRDIGEYVDPNEKEVFREDGDQEVRHLGEYIDPDADPGTMTLKNESQERNEGDLIDPDSEDLSKETSQEVQHLGENIDPDEAYDLVADEQPLH